MWVLSHSDVTIGLVPTWSDISVECHSWNGGTWSVTRNTQSGTKGHSDMTMGCSLTWSDMSAWPFWCDWGMCSHLIRYKGCFHSLGEWRHLVSYQEPSTVESPFDMVAGCVPPMVKCKYRSLLTWLRDVFPQWLDVSAEPFWHGCGMCSPHG